MARPKQSSLTENELEVMNILWGKAPLKVAEILERISRTPKPAYTSMMTMVQAMDKKGYLSSEKEGKAFYYSPVIKRESFVTQEIKRVSRRLFGAGPGALVVNLVEQKQLSAKEIEELKRLLEEQV